VGTPDGRFAGQVAIVTGSGRGIGRATAARLVGEGATVVVNDVDDAAVADTVGALAGGPGVAVPGLADVTSEPDVAAMVSSTLADHGRIDVLVNNAGGAPPGAAWSTVQDTTREDWDGFLALNLTSAFLCSRAVLPAMLERGYGRIVCVSSISGDNGQRAGAGYAAAKAGLTGLVASLAKEVGARGIGVNGVVLGNAPHPTRTPERQAVLDGWVHLGRVGRYEEFAGAVAFLCSEDASYLSGSMVAVDGGFHRFNQL
jgi:NAD(P)-dependent dehydrogenase (short-subunit alcohol dehydrogenase family)